MTTETCISTPASAAIQSDVQVPRSSRHMLALDGLRGVAILAVFFLHYGAGGIHSGSTLVRWTATVCGFGWSGVDLFFVLSGFLITGILYDTQNHAEYYKKFYARRALRIFPVYYLFILIVFAIVPFAAWSKGHLFFLVYLGYPAAIIWPALVKLPVRVIHLWSLQVEEQFYMVWPWLIRRLRSPRRILGLCAILVVVAPIARIAFPQWQYASLPCRMDDLAWGAALAILFRSDLWTRCQRSAWPFFAVSASATALICVVRHTTEHNDRLISTLGFSVIGIGCAALLVLSLGPLSGFFSLGVLRIFGKYSYGLYLYHYPLTTLTERAKPFFDRYPLGAITYVAACLAFNMAIAVLSFHLIEQPILKLKRRFAY